MLMPTPPGEGGKLADNIAGGRTKSLWRMLQFLDVADHPMTTQQLCKELELRPENFPRYIRLFISMGIAKEVHKIPVPGKRRAWYKAYQRTVKLAEVDDASEWYTVKTVLGGTLKGQLILLVKKEFRETQGGD